MPRKLTPPQLQAAELTALGCRGIDIAAQLNVTPETVCRWRQRADFVAHVNSLLSESRQAVEHRLQGLTGRATDTLDDALSGKPGYSGSDRIRAAGMVLEALKLHGIKPGPRTLEGVEQEQAYELLDEITGGR